jgi:hypothetical protein
MGKRKACICVALLSPAAAVASPYSVVPTAGDDGNPIDVHIHVDYDYDIERAAVVRERVGSNPDTVPGDPTPQVKDLYFKGARHGMTVGLELGGYHDFWLSVALPIVISQKRELLLDQRDTPCSFTPPATCTNRDNSSTIVDGLLPTNGFDAGDPVTGFPDEETIFRGPTRSGLDQIHVGAGIALMNQKRDDTKPTWKIAAEVRAPIGEAAVLDREDPGSETGIGRGVYELRLATSVARRLGWAEPYVELWWLTPVGRIEWSQFDDPGFGSRRTLTQPEGGIHFGFEAILVDRPDDHTKVSIDLSTRAAVKFEGRAYTPMWEVFAYAGDARFGGPLVLDADPVDPGMQAISHPGLTTVENFLELGTRIGVRAELGKHVHLGALVGVQTATDHAITFADAGTDLPACSGSVSTNCENDTNDVVNPGTDEVDPTHVPLIDLVGHRYILEEIFAVQVAIRALVLF